MLNWKHFLAATALALASGPVTAQEAQAPAPAPAPTAPAPAQAAPAPVAPAAAPLPDANPAMWVVRDEDTTIYLLGTFHMLDGRPWFNDEVRTAFDASSELVLEAIVPDNPADLQPLIVRYAVDPNGRRLSQLLTTEENARLNQALTGLGVPAGAFDPLEPWFVSMSLVAVASQQLGISPESGAERGLMHAARERNLPVHELEGIEWQLRLFDNMPEAQQLAQLRSTLESLDEMDDSLAPMLDAWSRGDVEGLAAIVQRYNDDDPELHRLLFTNRNATWAGWIQERMSRPGTVFMAVGAGHLAGNDSVLAVLASRGVNAERVPAAQ